MYKYIVHNFWSKIDNQNWAGLRNLFCESAVIDWINTNERFTVDGFMKANEAYPLKWQVKIIRVIEENGIVVSLVQVKTDDDPDAPSFYVSSFFEFENDKIKYLTENWGENGPPPQWRVDLNISTPIEI